MHAQARHERPRPDTQTARILREADEAAVAEPPAPGDMVAVRRAADGFLRWSRSPIDVFRVEDAQIPGPRGNLRVRLYRSSSRRAPLTVLIHGGGWAAGSIELADRLCRRLCRDSGRTIASIEYALAPEEPYPAGLDDCETATRWLLEHREDLEIGDGTPSIAGESAGASLSVGVCLRLASDARHPLGHQLLLYPALDDRCDSDSYARLGGGDFLVRRDAMRSSWTQYLAEGVPDECYAPARSHSLGGLPQATIVVCELDPMHDDGVAFARRLERDGVPTRIVEGDGLLHAFVFMDAASDTAAAMVDRLGDLLASGVAS